MGSTRVGDLVAAWFGGEITMFDACTDEPEAAWAAVLEILGRPLSDEQTANLAAGPLETLLAWHGPQVIDRVEDQARVDPRFRHLLGGVWRHGMSDGVWDRVVSARRKAW